MPLEGFFNRAYVEEVTVHRISGWTSTSDDHPLARARYTHAYTGNYAAAQQPTSQFAGATIEADADGTASELDVDIDVTTNDEDGSGTTATTVVDGNTYTDLGGFITQMETVTGVQAEALHAPWNYDTGTASFVDFTATDLPVDGRWLNFLFADHSAADEAFLRIGYPEPNDTGRLYVLRISGRVAHSGAGTVKLYRDADSSGDTAPELLLDLGATAATGVQQTYLDLNKLNAYVLRGPLLLGIEGCTNPTTIDFEVVTAPAEW